MAPARALVRAGGLAVLLVTVCGCRTTAQQIVEQRTQAAFEEDVQDLSPAAVSWHGSIRYSSPTSASSCGVSCLDSILEFKGLRLPEGVVEELTAAARDEQGLTNGRIRAALESAGLLAIHLQGEWHWPGAASPEQRASHRNPLHHVDLGNPPVLRISVPDDRFHYVLLVGYDEPTRSLIVVNPGRGMEVWPDTVLGAWEQAGRWFIAYKTPE